MNIHIILTNKSLLKGLRLVMWSLLHDPDQLREMLSTDQSLRECRSRGVPRALVSAKHFPRVIYFMQQLTEPPVFQTRL